MCRTGCPTQNHGSWGECARAANFQTQVNDDRNRSRTAWDRELTAYADAKRQGLQPKGTKMKQIVEAHKFADKTGVGDPYRKKTA